MERCFILVVVLSAELCACGNSVIKHKKIETFFAFLGVDCRKKHATAVLPHHLAGRQIDYCNEGLTYKILGLVVHCYAGKDLTIGAGTVIKSKLEKFVALLDRLAILYLDYAEVGFAESFEINVFLGEGLNLERRQSGLLCCLGGSFQLGKSFLGVNAGEENVACGNGNVHGQNAEALEAVPTILGGADALHDFCAAFGHEGDKQSCANTDALKEGVHNACKASLLALVLGENPRCILVNVLVGAGDDLEYFGKSVLESVLLHVCFVAVAQSSNHIYQRLVESFIGFLILRKGAVEVLLNHCNGTAYKVAEVIGEVYVDGLDEGLVGEVTVGAEGEGAQQEEAKCVNTELFCENVGIDNVALGLGHLAAVQKEPTVAEDLLGQRHTHAHEHGGPYNGMETNDLLTYEMNVSRPEFIVIIVLVIEKTESGSVIEESVNPNVYNVAGIKIYGNAPGEAGSGNAEVLETGLDEVVDHLVYAGTGLKEIGVLKKILNLVCILGKAEEVCLFLCVLNFTAAVGALAVNQLAFGPEAFAGLAVLALIGSLIDVAVVIHLLEDFLNSGNVIIVGGSDEAIVGNVHKPPKVKNALFALNDVVNELLGGNACGSGLILDLLAVLVGTGKEHDVIAGHALIAGHCIGSYGAVGVAYMKFIGRVVNRGGDIKFSLAHL